MSIEDLNLAPLEEEMRVRTFFLGGWNRLGDKVYEAFLEKHKDTNSPYSYANRDADRSAHYQLVLDREAQAQNASAATYNKLRDAREEAILEEEDDD